MSSFFNTEYRNDQDKKQFKRALIFIGIACIALAAIFLIILPSPTTAAFIGIGLLFTLGFGCCIAGTEDKENKE